MNVSSVKFEIAVKFCEKVCHPPGWKTNSEEEGLRLFDGENGISRSICVGNRHLNGIVGRKGSVIV